MKLKECFSGECFLFKIFVLSDFGFIFKYIFGHYISSLYWNPVFSPIFIAMDSTFMSTIFNFNFNLKKNAGIQIVVDNKYRLNGPRTGSINA